MAMTWDILLPTIPHRHEGLSILLGEISRQWMPGLGVLVSRDNLARPGVASYAKWNDLTRASGADYISFFGDDDFMAPDFVERVMEALQQEPDYVGFPVRYTLDGVLQVPVLHSLRYGGWSNHPDMLLRDIVHCNPIRRELALLTSWGTEHINEDALWSARLRQHVRTEMWIPDPMYYYQPVTSGRDFYRRREPLPREDIPMLPDYPWLTVIEDC